MYSRVLPGMARQVNTKDVQKQTLGTIDNETIFVAGDGKIPLSIDIILISFRYLYTSSHNRSNHGRATGKQRQHTRTHIQGH